MKNSRDSAPCTQASSAGSMSVEQAAKRVEKALRTAGLSVAEVLRRYNRGHNAFHYWKKGADKMPESFLREVAEVCAEAGIAISGHWLLTGEEPMVIVPESVAQRQVRLIREVLEEGRDQGGGAGDWPPVAPASPPPESSGGGRRNVRK